MQIPLVKRILLWLALALPCVALACGFWNARLFSQSLWSPAGLQRFEIYTAVFVLASAVVLPLRPSRYILLLAAVVLFGSTAIAGINAVGAVCLFLASAYALGRIISKTSSDLLAIVLGISAYIFLWQLLVQLPVSYPITYLIILATPLAVNRSAVARIGTFLARLLQPMPFVDPKHAVAAALLGYVTLIQWLVSLNPETSGDGLAMHLAIPASVANHHLWRFDAAHLTFAVMPMGGDWCYTAVYLLGGEYAARLLNFAFLLLIAALLYGVVRRWLAPGATCLIAALWISSPLANLVTGSLFVENAWALVTTGAFCAFLLFLETRGRAELYWTAALLGTSLAMKFGSIAIVLPLLLVLAVENIRIPRATRGSMTAAVALVLAFAAPTYVTAYARSGNPIFPFANKTFKSPYFDSKTDFRDARYHEPLTATMLYDVTVHTSRYYEGEDGAFGFEYLMLLPGSTLALLLFRMDGWRIAAYSLLLAAVFWLLTFQSQANVRYLYPAFPLLLIGIAWLLQVLSTNDRALYALAATIAAISILLNAWFAPSSGWYGKDFVLLTAKDREDHLKIGAPVRKLVEYLNLTVPGQPVLFLGTDQFAGLIGETWSDSWRHATFQRQWNSDADVRKELALVRSIGVRYFVAPVPEGPVKISWSGSRTFLIECTEPEFRYGNYYVARLKTDFSSGDPLKAFEAYQRRTKPALRGFYEDTDTNIQYQGSWLTDQQFPLSHGQSLTYSNTPGNSFIFNFDGTGVTWIYTKAENRGMASVVMDGKNVGIVDLYAPSTQWQSKSTFAGLEPGSHTLMVVVLDKSNPAAKDRFVDLDGLQVSSTQVR